MKSPFLAWKVSDSDEEHAEIIAARNIMEARRLGADIVNNGEFESCTAEREPDYDDVLGDADALAYKQLANGWWFGCNYCDCKNEHVSYDTEEDDDGEPIAQDPFVRHGDVYCSAWCAGAEAVRHVERRIKIWEALEWAVGMFPGARIDSVWPDTFAWAGAKSTNRIVATVWIYVPPQFGPDRFGWQVGQDEQDMSEHSATVWNEYRAWRDALRAEESSASTAA